MLKKLSLAISTASFVACSSFAVAETVPSPVGDFDVSMNAALTTDYMFRGISQTQGSGAIQGGLDIGHESGLYIGTWASNVDFGSESDATVEFDYYVGYGGDIGEDLSYDLGWVSYTYPGQSDLNFNEYYGSLSAFGFTLGTNYSDDFGGSDSIIYHYLGYEYELPYEIGLSLSYGYQDFKDATFDSGDDTYTDWSVGLGKSWAGLDFALTYTDTNLSSSDCSGFAGDSDYCDATAVFSVSKTL
jgi:uncharacterized protein (TIGR02001 family)